MLRCDLKHRMMSWKEASMYSRTSTLCYGCLSVLPCCSSADHRSVTNTHMSHVPCLHTLYTNTLLQGLLPLLSCAALLDSRKCNGSGTEQHQKWENLQASGAPAIQGRLYVRQDTTVRTVLPFHIDGPFFVSDGGRGGLKVSLTVHIQSLQQPL
jgi:hypothetical protein